MTPTIHQVGQPAKSEHTASVTSDQGGLIIDFKHQLCSGDIHLTVNMDRRQVLQNIIEQFRHDRVTK